ncbi:MAG: putative molibdopterin-dependent oxidoreductase YjgC [Desulforhopalus sp.]|jgi:predicted molibdopterin-dependent oxidoreductase YjgC
MKCTFVPSICSYCGTGCGVLFETIDGKLNSTIPMKSHPVSQGKLCIKGWNLHEHINSPMRLKKPMVKTFGRFINTSWDEAIQITADKFKEIIEKHGPDSIGVLVSAKMSNEENYLAQKLARAVFGTNNVDHCARL